MPCIDFDAHWKYIQIKYKGNLKPYNRSTDAYDQTEITGVDYFTYYNSQQEQQDGETFTFREEQGFCLRVSTIGDDHRNIVIPRTIIVDDLGDEWVIFGEIKLVTARTRYLVSAYRK